MIERSAPSALADSAAQGFRLTGSEVIDLGVAYTELRDAHFGLVAELALLPLPDEVTDYERGVVDALRAVGQILARYEEVPA